MSTREDILAALTDHPAGLTSKELAPLCPSCECDALVVGRTIAVLRGEDVIHAGTELREGGTIWIFGKKEKTSEPEAHITLAGGELPRTDGISEAARAIANMRVNRLLPPKPAPAQEVTPMTMREAVEALLKKHGPMDSRAMRKHGIKQAGLVRHLHELIDRKVLKRLGGGPRSTIYGLPGQALSERKEIAPPQPRKVAKAPKIDALERGWELGRRRPNGNGHQPAKAKDSLYGAALLDLQERRDALMAEVAKLDNAIVAVGALA